MCSETKVTMFWDGSVKFFLMWWKLIHRSNNQPVETRFIASLNPGPGIFPGINRKIARQSYHDIATWGDAMNPANLITI
jgi:hypothetical protein